MTCVGAVASYGRRGQLALDDTMADVLMRYLAWVALFIVGCRQPKPVIVHENPPYDPALDPITGPYWRQANEAFVDESCHPHTASVVQGAPGLTPQTADQLGDPPSMHEIDAGAGVMVKQPCGLVINEIASPNLFADFVREICGSVAGSVSEDCSKRFIDMFFARLGERYVATDWAAVDLRCRAHPFDCRRPVDIERIILDSHNAGVRAWYMRTAEAARANVALQNVQAAQQAMAQAAAEHERQAERRRSVLRVIAAGLHGFDQAATPPPAINCTSNTLGNTTSTTCH